MSFRTIGLLLALCPTMTIAQPKGVLTLAQTQANRLLITTAKAVAAGSTAQKILVSPRALTPSGALETVPARDWTSGFFPGELWYLYELTGKPAWLAQAKTYTARLEAEKLNGTTHDMGFKLYCSFGNGYRLTQNPAYRDVLVQGAKTLITRFKPAAGILRSWDHHKDVWQSPVIIDNMLNLELLFEATKLTGDSTYYKVAITHARTTLKNHYRPDNSSYHVVDYDTLTGRVLQKTTHQGYSNESVWARGQAWGLYGYTMCYRETGDKLFLEHAQKIAAFILNHPNLPADLVPYWDFNAPGVGTGKEPRDVSAATVMASALYELSTYVPAEKRYRQTADKLMANLETGYLSPAGANQGFLLMHSTGSKPSNTEVDAPLIYADYYFLEALLRQRKLNQNKPLF